MPAATSQLAQAVRHQIEYYLSLDNLVRDLFLRAKMDPDGWIPLSIIAGFNRVRVMTSDVTLIAGSLLRSPVGELSPDALMVSLKGLCNRIFTLTNGSDLGLCTHSAHIPPRSWLSSTSSSCCTA